jgi:hypothetical protein
LESQSKAFVDSIQPLLGQKAYVSGVLSEDTAQGGALLVQPLDALWAVLPPVAYPDWCRNILGSLDDPQCALVYRVLAASDSCKGVKPPQSDKTRPQSIPFPYPPKPAKPSMKIDYEIKKSVMVNADFQLSTDLVHEKIALDLKALCAKEGGPGVFIGDLAAFWRHENPNR